MQELSIREMIEGQLHLWEKNKEKWAPMEPVYGRNMLLWLIEELGEAIAVIKKKGESAIMEDPAVRAHFIEELADVMMYYVDALNRYGISAEEFAEVYRAKFQRNLGRDFAGERQALQYGSPVQHQ